MMVLFGSYNAFPFVVTLAVWGAAVIGAIYMLRAVRNILHGPESDKWTNVRDAGGIWRKLPFALLIFTLLLFGFMPRLLTDKIKPSAEEVVIMAHGERETVSPQKFSPAESSILKK
jgi:NADH-quinone oxidoreductase subunit M